MSQSMYKEAMRKQLRFNHKGLITTEDLWQLPLTTLDEMYKSLKAELKAADGDSLLKESTPQKAVLELKLKIITDIVTTKLDDKNAAAQRLELARQKSQLIDAIKDRQDEAFKNLSEDELKAKLAEIEKQL